MILGGAVLQDKNLLAMFEFPNPAEESVSGCLPNVNPPIRGFA